MTYTILPIEDISLLTSKDMRTSCKFAVVGPHKDFSHLTCFGPCATKEEAEELKKTLEAGGEWPETEEAWKPGEEAKAVAACTPSEKKKKEKK